jgi:sec-independent protein translocase protein TatA
MELVVVLAIALLFFGPKRLPDLGRSLGGGMREFRSSLSGKEPDERLARPALERADGSVEDAES